MEAPESKYRGKRHAAKRDRIKADYLVEPTNLLGRWKQRRAERWLVNDSVGRVGSSLEDSREIADEARRRWRQWRAEQLGGR
jgi:hypothetical protein